MSWLRPANRSASVSSPSGPSKRYVFSTFSHGSARRRRLNSSRSRVNAFSLSSSALRADTHSSWVTTACRAIPLLLTYRAPRATLPARPAHPDPSAVPLRAWIRTSHRAMSGCAVGGHRLHRRSRPKTGPNRQPERRPMLRPSSALHLEHCMAVKQSAPAGGLDQANLHGRLERGKSNLPFTAAGSRSPPPPSGLSSAGNDDLDFIAKTDKGRQA